MNFLFTLLAFYLLVEVIKVNYLIALTVVSILGMFLTYTLNHIWVFRLEEKLEFRGRIVRYILAGSVSIAINAVTLKFLVDRTDYDPFWLQLTLIPLIVLFNFSTAKYWALRPLP